MNDDFAILLKFLEHRSAEVTGRAAAEIPAAVREKLARFAAGSCTPEERDQVKELLQQEPDLIPVVVTETVALRQAAE